MNDSIFWQTNWSSYKDYFVFVEPDHAVLQTESYHWWRLWSHLSSLSALMSKEAVYLDSIWLWCLMITVYHFFQDEKVHESFCIAGCLKTQAAITFSSTYVKWMQQSLQREPTNLPERYTIFRSNLYNHRKISMGNWSLSCFCLTSSWHQSLKDIRNIPQWEYKLLWGI